MAQQSGLALLGHKDRQEAGSGGQLRIPPHCSSSLPRIRPGPSNAPLFCLYECPLFPLMKLLGGIERNPLPSCTHTGAFRVGALSHDALGYWQTSCVGGLVSGLWGKVEHLPCPSLITASASAPTSLCPPCRKRVGGPHLEAQ